MIVNVIDKEIYIPDEWVENLEDDMYHTMFASLYDYADTELNKYGKTTILEDIILMDIIHNIANDDGGKNIFSVMWSYHTAGGLPEKIKDIYCL